MRARWVWPVLALALAGCGDPGTALNDESTCPGETCADDTQARYDAVAALDRVTEVASVSRSEGFDRGSSRAADVSADVDSEAEAVDVGIAVLRVLDAWPEHDGGDALATVTADPAVPVRQVEVGVQSLAPEFYDPCRPAVCRSAVAGLERAVGGVEGVGEVLATVEGGTLTLEVAATQPAGQVVTAVLDAVETDLDLRVARSVRVEVEHTGPLVVTLRLSDGQVCEQPPGMTVACNSANSVPLSQ